MCVAVRDLVVHGVLSDMMAGRPAVYATFASYDEVAHHSGMERADTLEALRKLDQQFGRISRARRYAPRPYEIVVLSDHGQTQGATFLQRNGYALEDLVRRALSGGTVAKVEAGDEHDTCGGAGGERGDRARRRRREAGRGRRRRRHRARLRQPRPDLPDGAPRAPDPGGDRRAPPRAAPPALRAHPHIGFLLVRSRRDGAVVLGPRGERHLATGRVEGEDPLAAFSPTAAEHLARADGFPHVADIMVNSFYDPELDEGCAFEELISFHGGMGGSQTRPFIMHPVGLPPPDGPIRSAEAVHAILTGWRAMLQGPASGP